MDQESEYSSESLAEFYRDWNKVTDKFFPPAKAFVGFYPKDGKTTWDKFNKLSASDERRMLRSEGEGD